MPINVGTILLTIRRFKASIGKRRNYKYELTLSGSARFVMNCKKISFNKSSNYLFSFDLKKCSVDKPGYIGKLRSNFLGTQYDLYDTGKNQQSEDRKSVV